MSCAQNLGKPQNSGYALKQLRLLTPNFSAPPARPSMDAKQAAHWRGRRLGGFLAAVSCLDSNFYEK
jgi:hypothetical protein